MIAEECKKLRAQLGEVAQAEFREKVVDQLESRRVELLVLRDSVTSVTNALNALANRTEIVDQPDSTKSIALIRKIRETLRDDPLSMTKKQTLLGMTRTLNSFAKKGSAAAEATWEQYMPKARPIVDTNQLAQAEDQEDFKTVALKLRNRAKYAEEIGKKPPANEEDFVEIESAWDDIRGMISELPEIARDPKVQEFLKAANSQGGASIDLLTDEVREWLHENNIAEKYRITTLYK